MIESLEAPDGDEDAIEAEAHRRYLGLERGVDGIDGDEVLAQLRARRDLEIEDQFLLAVEHAFQRIREHPEIGEALVRGERKLLLKRFPYKLIYRPNPVFIFIVAITHHKRRYGYWPRRREPGES